MGLIIEAKELGSNGQKGTEGVAPRLEARIVIFAFVVDVRDIGLAIAIITLEDITLDPGHEAVEEDLNPYHHLNLDPDLDLEDLDRPENLDRQEDPDRLEDLDHLEGLDHPEDLDHLEGLDHPEDLELRRNLDLELQNILRDVLARRKVLGRQRVLLPNALDHRKDRRLLSLDRRKNLERDLDRVMDLPNQRLRGSVL
eukprot:TRINITY_DN584_c0_g1_i1.p2 TRINITY_DN584_c0_g1~~TRINITY_DN584_c0_g1_i1.p2  ORF type:complete len:198 (+),score=36.28 TRINITY_DN584_c0_g1_i1:203-796(+)